MIGIVIVLLVIIVALFAVLVILQRRVDLLRQVADFNRGKSHAMCIAHVSHYVGNHFAAKVLKAAADDYASAEGQHEVKVIINGSSHQTLSENPIPSLWLHKRADRLVAEVEVDS